MNPLHPLSKTTTYTRHTHIHAHTLCQPKNKLHVKALMHTNALYRTVKPSAACIRSMSNVHSRFQGSFVCHYELCSPPSNGSSRLEISTIYPTLWHVLVLKTNWLRHSPILISPYDRASQGHKGI